jgi:DNA-binding PadR family transcriptional regulator
MRGMLSFTALWLLSRQPMCGDVLATEIGKRRGDKPKPGTIYPALKELSNKNWIKCHRDGRTLVYELTPRGRVVLANSVGYFRQSFGDIFSSIQT